MTFELFLRWATQGPVGALDVSNQSLIKLFSLNPINYIWLTKSIFAVLFQAKQQLLLSLFYQLIDLNQTSIYHSHNLVWSCCGYKVNGICFPHLGSVKMWQDVNNYWCMNIIASEFNFLIPSCMPTLFLRPYVFFSTWLKQCNYKIVCLIYCNVT